jgi:hypothetical protein
VPPQRKEEQWLSKELIENLTKSKTDTMVSTAFSSTLLSTFCDEHQLPVIIGASILRGAMAIEWDGNIEPKLREEQGRTVVKQGIDRELDKIKDRYDGLNSLLKHVPVYSAVPWPLSGMAILNPS